ncbi:MAG: Asp-tRNA(Asn)/Glu-tRNA(Gln) amidotransferase subunit GatB [Phycisphaeraceae bacterium]|nr:MAG: Asp-tRNA(Asn)/Glu-tRNA(Gln) amidotransferase subunit GatB [Phycisphaeraceae bacterium]
MPLPGIEDIKSVELIVGMEIHVELAARSKMFCRSPNPAHLAFDGAPPNSLVDPVVLGLPGALPVPNRAAVESAVKVGLALNCSIARRTKWDRKSYFYPDLPKGYQISQYDIPLCFDGSVDLPGLDDRGQPDPERPGRRIGIVRAHLEEDAGKLLHESPGGGALDGTLADFNRAGTPLLEVVTQPDFRSADEAVAFARMLRSICRFLGVSECVMQKGHIRFEPNINAALTLRDGRVVRTPIVEVKNLNSFKSLRGAIEFEAAEQPARWAHDRREMGRGTKTTRGWDDRLERTVAQREKEDADDYRYFPDPDLPAVVIDDAWLASIRDGLPELPAQRESRYVREYGLSKKEAAALLDEPGTCRFYESTIEELVPLGVAGARAGRLAANFVLQSGQRRANERGVGVETLGITPSALARIAALREEGRLSSQSADELFGFMCEPENLGMDAAALAAARGLLIVRDDAALERWCDEVIAANPKVAMDVTSGKVQAVGRLVGEVMKMAGAAADAKTVREALLRKLTPG